MCLFDNENIKILQLPVGQLQSNCYLYIDKESENALIIDPGDAADFIARKITDERCHPKMILATHGHFDHIMAAFELQLNYSIPFIINKKDEFLVKRMRTSAKHFLGIVSDPPPKITSFMKEKDEISLGENQLVVMETPGHTPGAVCFYDKKNSVLFTGDLLFADGGVGRTDFSYSKPHDLESSIRKILKLSEDTIVLCGHGKSTSIGKEKELLNY